MENNSLWAILGPIVVPIVTLIIGMIVEWYRTRKRPHYLVCEEKARTSLEVIEEVREGTEIRYGGTRVDRLSLEKLRLFNQGPEVLKGADFTVRLNPEAKIVGIPPPKILPEGEEKIVFPWQEQPPNQNEKKFHVHCLNPFKPYKQEIVVDLICDGEISEASVFGVGPGWSVKFWSLEEKKRISNKIYIIYFACSIIGGGGLLVWANFFQEKIASSWVSMPLLLGSSALFSVGVFIAPMLKWIYRRRHGISL